MTDDLLARMLAQRDRLTDLLAVEADGSKAAALSRELRQVLADVERLQPAKKESKVDEIAARRAARNADAPDSAPPGRRSQPRRSGRVG